MLRLRPRACWPGHAPHAPGHWLLGNFKCFGSKSHEVIRSLAERFSQKPFMIAFPGVGRMVVVTDGEDGRFLLNRFPNKPYFVGQAFELISGERAVTSLTVTSTRDPASRIKRLHLFSKIYGAETRIFAQRLLGFVDALCAHFDALPDAAVLDVAEHAGALILDTFSAAAFCGFPMRAIERESPGRNLLTDLFIVNSEFTSKPPFLSRLLFMVPSCWRSSHAAACVARSHVRAVAQAILAHGMSAASASPRAEHTLLGRILTLPEDDRVAEIIFLLSAGTGTTADTIAFALHAVAAHPCVAERLQHELDAALEDFKHSTEDAMIEALLPERCPFLDAVMKETFRLYPVAGDGFDRVADHDVVLPVSGTHIRRGQVVRFHSFTAHTAHGCGFSLPQEFLPERWLGDHFVPPGFLPFGAGSRDCAGQHLARQQVRIVLGVLLQRYVFALAPGETQYKEMHSAATMCPMNGVRCIIKRR